MLRLYLVLFCRGKLAVEDKPSGLTSSVERGDKAPPISKMGPPSPSTSQQRWLSLHSSSLTEVGVKVPVRGFSFRQDCCVSDEGPPQRRSLQRLCEYLAPPGKSRR